VPEPDDGSPTVATQQNDTERSWLAIEVTTKKHAPINGPNLLVLATDEHEAVAIVEKALDKGLVGALQGVSDISGADRQLDDVSETTPAEWLTALKSPNMALWVETDATGSEVIQTMTRGTARSLNGGVQG